MLRDKRTLYYSVIVYRDAERDGYVAASAFKMRYPGDFEGCARGCRGHAPEGG